MKAKVVRCALLLTGLLLAAAAQDMLPPLFGTKLPVLLACASCGTLPVAVAAGIAADALSTAPFGCHASFFLLAALRVGRLRLPAAAAGFLLPCWLALWGRPCSFSTLVVSTAAAAVLAPLFAILGRRAALHAGVPDLPEEREDPS